MTFGSDCPIFPGPLAANPFTNIWCAVNRGSEKTWHFPGLFGSDDFKMLPNKDEALSVADCVDAYTINGAKQLLAADRTGSITRGKDADFVILNQDIFAVDPADLKDVTVAATYFRGACVYRMP
jgi:predicted amidohydrolase YtcJ